MKRNQLVALLAALVLYAACAFVSYAFFLDELTAAAGVPVPELGVPSAVLGLANAGLVLVLYGLFGLAGYWFAGRLGLPGIYLEGGGWRVWAGTPLLWGAACGLALILGDALFAPFNGFGPFPHPAFPLSILASLSAGIGEEILFRGFVFGLWATILDWALRRIRNRGVVLWGANLIAALAFGAGHLGVLMAWTGAASLAELNPLLLLEIFLLNGIVGLAAGQQYVRAGLVAAMGVHFWTDVFWHVLWGLAA